MATRIRFTKDFDGSVETNYKPYKKDDVASVTDFEAGQLVGSGNAERVNDATDPHSPLNLAGPSGKPLAQARPHPTEPQVIAGVEVKDEVEAGVSANDAANLAEDPGEGEPSEDVKGSASAKKAKGKK